MITQRRASLVLLGLISFGIGAVLVFQLLAGRTVLEVIPSIVATVVMFIVWGAYAAGWEYARHTAILFLTLISASIQEVGMLSLAPLITPALALVMTGPFSVLISAVVIIGSLAWRSVNAPGGGVYSDPINLTIYLMAAGSIFVGGLIAEQARRAAEASTARVQEALAQAEDQSQERQQQADMLTAQNAAQQALLDLVATLETPTVALAEGLTLVPIVGAVDSLRAEKLTERVLETVQSQRTRLLIMDIAGIAQVDTLVARTLINTARAVRLLGCTVVLTGISPEVAATLTHLGIGLNDVIIRRAPQEVLTAYLKTGMPIKA